MFPLRIRIQVPKTGIRLQFWVRSRREVWPRLPLGEPPDIPAHLVDGYSVPQPVSDSVNQPVTDEQRN
jgi:hypothetical protein